MSTESQYSVVHITMLITSRQQYKCVFGLTQKVNSELMSFNSEFQTFGAITRSLVCRTACSSHRHAKHRSTAESLGVVGLHLCTGGNAILYCIQCTVGQTSSEGRSCECIYAVNRSHDHSKTVTFVHPWPCSVSHKFAHAKKAILRHRLLGDTLKSYVGRNVVVVYDITNPNLPKCRIAER